MFLTKKEEKNQYAEKELHIGRNPLKAGQCFLQKMPDGSVKKMQGRNPLKAGQCFLQVKMKLIRISKYNSLQSQSPQSGSMFLT